jgi:hypothetical protein
MQPFNQHQPEAKSLEDYAPQASDKSDGDNQSVFNEEDHATASSSDSDNETVFDKVDQEDANSVLSDDEPLWFSEENEYGKIVWSGKEKFDIDNPSTEFIFELEGEILATCYYDEAKKKFVWNDVST